MKHVFSFVAILTSMIQYDPIKTLTMAVIWFSNNSFTLQIAHKIYDALSRNQAELDGTRKT